MIEFGARLTLQDQMSATLVRNIQAQRQFQEAIDSTRSSLEQMTGGNYSTDVDVDTSAAQQQVDQIQEVLDQVNGTDTTATVEADTSEAQRETEQLRENLDGLRGTVDSRVNVNDSGANQRVSALRERLASLRSMVSKGKLNVVEYGATVCTYELDENTNITESAFKETLENMVNKVRIYDGDGKQIGVVQNTKNQKYGIFQETYTKEKDKNATTTAKSKLHGIDKTATIKALGKNMMAAITGNGVAVVDKATGLKGLFWIIGDTHVWEKGVHTMTLTLEFKKAMDTKEV